MKIALVIDKFEVGGGVEHLYQICRCLPEYRFGVFAKDGSSKNRFLSLDNVQVFCAQRLRESILRFDPDIIHIHHLWPLVKLYKLNIPTIFTVHGIHLHKYEFLDGLLNKIRFYLRYYLEKHLYAKVKKIIVVSNDDKKFIGQKFCFSNVEVISNYVDMSAMDGKGEIKGVLERDLGTTPDVKYFLMIANFNFSKNHECLIRAVDVVVHRFNVQSYRFLLLGEGDTKCGSLQLAKKLKVSEFVLFLGAKYDKYQLLKSVHRFILPSRWEGQPISIIEALMCRIPVIASNTYGIRELAKIFSDEILLFENLLYEDLALKLIESDKMKSVQNEQSLMEKLKMFDIQNINVKLKSVYMDLSSVRKTNT